MILMSCATLLGVRAADPFQRDVLVKQEMFDLGLRAGVTQLLQIRSLGSDGNMFDTQMKVKFLYIYIEFASIINLLQ